MLYIYLKRIFNFNYTFYCKEINVKIFVLGNFEIDNWFQPALVPSLQLSKLRTSPQNPILNIFIYLPIYYIHYMVQIWNTLR